MSNRAYVTHLPFYKKSIDLLNWFITTIIYNLSVYKTNYIQLTMSFILNKFWICPYKIDMWAIHVNPIWNSHKVSNLKLIYLNMITNPDQY